MSYGEERATLDFSGMHVACLSGDNGNGKSALLDAMTYALWGKTRASGSQISGEDDLVRLGAEEMEVQFEFRLGDDLYRASRKRSRRTRTGDWQVFLCDTTGTWRPVGGSTMQETGRNLIRLLHMEYETFLNSAYIQQGHADEFTRQKPMDRKRILADILDLSRYDRLEEMARERRTEADLVLKDLEGEIRHYETRAGEEAVYRERLKEQEEAAAIWAKEREAREVRLNVAREQQAALETKVQALRQREERLHEVEGEQEELERRIVVLRGRIEQDAALIAQKPGLLTDIERLQANRARVEQLSGEVNRLNEAKQKLATVKGRLEAARLKLQHEVSSLEAEWRQVETRERQIVDLNARLADLTPKLAHFTEAKAEREAVGVALQAAQEAFTGLKAQSEKIQSEIGEVEEILSVLAPSRTGVKSACPVCQSDLSGGRLAAVEMKQKQKLSALKATLVEVKRDGVASKKEQDSLQKQAERLEEQLRGLAALNANRVEWERQREGLIEANTVRETLFDRLETLRCRIAAEEYGAEERAQIATLEQEIAGGTAGVQAYQEAQAVVRDLTAQEIERKTARLEEAERAQAEFAQELEQAVVRFDRRSGQIATERKRLENLQTELSDYDAARLEYLTAEGAVREAAEARETAQGQAERFRHAVEECAKAQEQAARKKAERDKVAKDKQAYTELAAAFGKKGVQAHIIDNALPEIQEETNRLLARLTDSAMQIELSTLRQARTGSSQIETLDISITDDAGTRPYEMYSGGEAFRVNFAIRIALSRLLSRRAGASLQTLIIDEGFGTQDAKGRERLIEAIESVKDEFALILLISHIEELKDAFPTRIEIIKTPTGSQINYVE